MVLAILGALLEGGLLRILSGGRSRAPAASDSACAAFGSTDLGFDAPGVYLCRACGYEGGSKRGDFEEQAREHAWASHPAPERIASATSDLATARHLLAALPGSAHELVARLIVNANGQAVWNPKLRLDRDQTFRDVQLAIENLFAEVTGCVATAAEKVPEIEVPPTPVLGTGRCHLGEKWDEVVGDVSELTASVDRAEKILALVPRTDPGLTGVSPSRTGR